MRLPWQPQLVTVEGLYRWLTVFLAAEVELAALPVDLMPAQPSRLADAQPVTVHEQNQSAIAFGMPSCFTNGFDQQLYFVGSQVFSRSQVSIFRLCWWHKGNSAEKVSRGDRQQQLPIVYLNARGIFNLAENTTFSAECLRLQHRSCCSEAKLLRKIVEQG